MDETTGTSNLAGLVIAQPRHGYRFSSDSVALAEFLTIGSSESLLDLGTGVGIIPLLIWQRHCYQAAVGIELQQELANFAIRNVSKNGLSKKISIVQGDLRRLTLENIQLPLFWNSEGRFNVVSANPPYWAAGRGRISPNLQRALARHEIELTFDDLVVACQRFLTPGGRFYFVHAAKREDDVVSSLEAHGFQISKKQQVNGTSRQSILLIEARKVTQF